MEEQLFEEGANLTRPGAYEWMLLAIFSTITAFGTLFWAIRDGMYRDRLHLFSIGCVGSVVGLGSVSLAAHSMGGVRGMEFFLLFVSAGAAVGGRVLEFAITKTIAKIFGVDDLGDYRDLFVRGGDRGLTHEPNANQEQQGHLRQEHEQHPSPSGLGQGNQTLDGENRATDEAD